MTTEIEHLLCSHYQTGLRDTEARVIDFLRKMSELEESTFTLPSLDEVSQWDDADKRRLGIFVEFCFGILDNVEKAFFESTRREYLPSLMSLLNPDLVCEHPWYVGDRCASPIMDDLVLKWGMCNGLRFSRVIQGLKTGIV